jgi:hypothetical protein
VNTVAIARQGSNPQLAVIIIPAPCRQRMIARIAYTLSLSGQREDLRPAS